MAVAASVTLAACGSSSGGSSSNGIASKSPEEIVSASSAAALGATSVHLTTTAGQVSLDVRLTRSGGSGRLKLSGNTLEMIRIGSTIYIKATPTVYRNLGIKANVPPNAWLKAPARSTPQLTTFTEMSGEISRLVHLEGALTKGPTTTINGQSVVELKQTTKIYTRSLYVATTGPPHPIEILLRGQVTGTTTFSEWDKPVTLTAPASSIDITRLKKPLF
jgi:hypothetical protein